MPRKSKKEPAGPESSPPPGTSLEAQIEALLIEVRGLRHKMEATIGRHPLSRANDARLPRRKRVSTVPPPERRGRRS